MSNLDNITSKIIEDAKLKAEEIINDAKDSAEKIVEDKILQGEKKKALIIENSEKEAKTLIDRKLSKQNLEVRDDLISAKQEVVNRVIDMVKYKLNNLDDKSYINFLKKSLSSFEGDNLELIVPEDKRELVKKENLNIRLSDDEAISSGFAVRAENMYYNNDFDGVVESKRDDLTIEIMNKLFES